MINFKGILIAIILISSCVLVVFAILWAIGFPVDAMPMLLGILGAIAIAGLIGSLLLHGIENLPENFKKKADPIIAKVLLYIVYAFFIYMGIAILIGIVRFILSFFD